VECSSCESDTAWAAEESIPVVWFSTLFTTTCNWNLSGI